MTDQDVIPIENDDLANLLNKPDEYKSWVIEILELDSSKLAQKIKTRLEENIIDNETDILLRQLTEVIPYNMIIPFLRDQLGLSIQSDKDCVESLEGIKKYLEDEGDLDLINQIIEYVNSTEGELDENIIPEIDLLGVIDKIPVEKFPEIYNCIDYITKNTEE